MTNLTPVTQAPVFVGGTGRSGTTIVARLIGQHSRYATLSRELKFHCHPGGLMDLLDDRVDLDTFCATLRDRWWGANTPPGASSGFLRICAADRFDAAVAAFRHAFADDRVAAARGLVHAIADPFAQRRQKPGWVEHTTTSVREANRLALLFADMKVIHVARDGRDVAASLLNRDWGPNDVVGAVRYWAERLLAAHRGSSALGADQLLVISLEHLVRDDRDATYTHLLRFLGIDDEPLLRRFFEEQMPTDAAHIGRWRSLQDADALNAAYARLRQRLIRHGVQVAAALPEPDRATSRRALA